MISRGIQLVGLEDAGVAVLDCEHRTPALKPDGYVYVAIPDLVEGRIDTSRARRISPEDYESWTRRTTPESGDVVVTRRGRVGDSAVVPEGLKCAIGQNLVILRSDGTRLDQRYLRWAVRSPQWWSEVDRLINVGAVFSSLNVRDIARVRVPAHELAEQRAIADVLSALDDKIAANTRLARVADELASQIFTRAVRGIEPGDQTFGEAAEVRGGGTPSSTIQDYWDGDIRWATPTDVTGLTGPYLVETARKITTAGLANCSSALHPAGSILMTSRATIGAFALARVPTAVNQGFIVVVPNGSAPGLWLFHEMRSRIEEFTSLANGATFLELSRGNFKSFHVRLAEPAVMAQFQEHATALHDRAAAALRENQRLAATRDALLPALMSGHLRVRDAEIRLSL